MALRFGPRLRELRTQAGLSLRGLDRVSGVSKSNISGYENGAHEPRTATEVLELETALRKSGAAVSHGELVDLAAERAVERAAKAQNDGLINWWYTRHRNQPKAANDDDDEAFLLSRIRGAEGRHPTTGGDYRDPKSRSLARALGICLNARSRGGLQDPEQEFVQAIRWAASLPPFIRATFFGMLSQISYAFWRAAMSGAEHGWIAQSIKTDAMQKDHAIAEWGDYEAVTDLWRPDWNDGSAVGE